MRIPLWLVAGLLAAAACLTLLVLKQQNTKHAREITTLRQAWAAEKAELEAALEESRLKNGDAPSLAISTPTSRAQEPGLSPADIIVRLKNLGGSGPGSAARTREAIYLLEQLTRLGTASLPAIGGFMARNEDVEFDTSWFQGRAAREGRLPDDVVAPVTLRLALTDVARKIGGAEAETLLESALRLGYRGVEVAWVNRSLYELAGKAHQETAVAVARNLLNSAAPVNSSGVLDRYHREYLFAVLAFYGDSGYAAEARNQLVRMDNQIDRGALRYLQESLGAQAVPIIAEAYRNPALATNSAAKEPLARLALSFVGADGLANEFWAQAINDPALTKDHRRNLIEDLNEDGLNFRNLTPTDLPVIESRISIIEQLAPNPMDKVNAEAFAEAYKDLVNMKAKLTGQPPAAQP